MSFVLNDAEDEMAVCLGTKVQQNYYMYQYIFVYITGMKVEVGRFTSNDFSKTRFTTYATITFVVS